MIKYINFPNGKINKNSKLLNFENSIIFQIKQI